MSVYRPWDLQTFSELLSKGVLKTSGGLRISQNAPDYRDMGLVALCIEPGLLPQGTVTNHSLIHLIFYNMLSCAHGSCGLCQRYYLALDSREISIFLVDAGSQVVSHRSLCSRATREGHEG
jgi:hypothetical protein